MREELEVDIHKAKGGLKYVIEGLVVSKVRNPHQCLTILDDFRPGNLLAHLPFHLRSVASRNIATHDKSNWMTKTFFERISLNTQCPKRP